MESHGIGPKDAASPKSLQTDTAFKDMPPHLNDLLRTMSGEPETGKLEIVVQVPKEYFQGDLRNATRSRFVFSWVFIVFCLVRI